LYSKQELHHQAITLLQRIPYYDPQKFPIHLEYVKSDMVPSILIEMGEYHLDTYERGKLIQRESTTDVQVVLFWILEYAICQFASKEIWEKYASSNRLRYTDAIRQEERELKVKSFEYIGGPFSEWYFRSKVVDLP